MRRRWDSLPHVAVQWSSKEAGTRTYYRDGRGPRVRVQRSTRSRHCPACRATLIAAVGRESGEMEATGSGHLFAPQQGKPRRSVCAPLRTPTKRYRSRAILPEKGGTGRGKPEITHNPLATHPRPWHTNWHGNSCRQCSVSRALPRRRAAPTGNWPRHAAPGLSEEKAYPS